MSLIDEALRRARQDVARQDATQRHAYPAMPAQVRGTAPGSRLLLVGLLGGALIAGLAFGGAYWLFGRDAKAPAAEVSQVQPAPIPPVQAIPAEPEPIAAAPPVYSAPLPSPPEDVASPGVSLPPAQAPTVTPLTARETAPPPALPPAAAPQPAPASPAPEALPEPAPEPIPAPAAPAAAPGVYYREAPLPGGGKLELRGIAFSGTQPTALVNDRVMVAGESVEGYTLVKIEPKRVELQGPDGAIVLTLQQ